MREREREEGGYGEGEALKGPIDERGIETREGGRTKGTDRRPRMDERARLNEIVNQNGRH